MRAILSAVLCCIAVDAAQAQAPVRFEDCRTQEQCLHALDALVDDVRAHGTMNQSGAALLKAGPRALPAVLLLLEDEHKVADAHFILVNMKSDAASGLDDWLAVARDEKAPEPKRLAALRGIGVLGTRAKRVAPDIRKLRDETHDVAVGTLAVKVLTAMGDDSTVSEALECAGPKRESVEGCLSQLAAYGPAARPYANWILDTFTVSEEDDTRAAAASALGYIGYREGEARLREMLRDPDWRVVYAATRALGWLGAKDALRDVEKIADTYWLEAVREEARKAADALRAPAGALPRPAVSEGWLDYPPDVTDFNVDAANAPDVAPCESGRWRWKGSEFGAPDKSRMALDLGAPRGRITGSDHGEWGGELIWNPDGGEKSLLSHDNVQGIEAARQGFVVAFGGGGLFRSYDPHPPPAVSPDGDALETIEVSNGPDGSGWAMLAQPDASGAWRMRRVAVFPRGVEVLATIGSGVYSAWSGNRAVVFSEDGIQGVAACVAER